MTQDRLYYIWLNIALDAGRSVAKTLLENTGGIRDIYAMSREDYAAYGIKDADIERLCDKDLTMAERCAAYCEKENIGIVCYEDAAYPGRLRAITEPPAMLYYRGRLEKLDMLPIFAMVGTRSCTEEGFTLAYKIAYRTTLCGGSIITGLALGIDAACTTACLDAGGYGIGVLGCGIDRIYPAENKELFLRMCESGLILTEFPPFTKPNGFHFPVRNRVISALSCATAIFEADASSGALITATHALSQGKKLYAIPGDAENRQYEGSLGLLKNGAELLTSASDIIEDYVLMYPTQLTTMVAEGIPAEKLAAAVKEAYSVNRDMKKASRRNRTLPEPHRIKRERRADVIEDAPMPAFRTETETQLQQPSADIPEASDIPQAPDNTDTLSPLEQQVLGLVRKHIEISADDVAAHGFSAEDALSALTLLEVYGFIKALPGGRFRMR